MSPEQLTGGVVNERSDLFALGVITVELLTGQRPFQGKTFHEQLSAIINQPFAFDSDRAEASPLRLVLQKALAKETKDRFASASEMQEQIVSAIRCYAQALELQIPGFDDKTRLFHE
jgi:serine/threonine-protein kinase